MFGLNILFEVHSTYAKADLLDFSSPDLRFQLPALSLPVVRTAKGSEAKADEIPSARVATAQRGNLAHTLSLAGQFQPYQVVDVHPKVTGFMAKINVDIGDKVHKGQSARSARSA